MERTGSFAEYRDGITQCPECGSLLSDKPVSLSGKKEKVDSDLGKKILITIGLLLFNRLLLFIPAPGMSELNLSGLPAGNLIKNYFNSPSISIAALGIMPYISAYVLVELSSLVIPALKRWRGQKKEGRRKLAVTARWLALALSIVQATGLVISISKMTAPHGTLLFAGTGFGVKLMVVITLTVCVFLNLWIADLITARGIGNGISMLIVTGIVISIFSRLNMSFTNTMAYGHVLKGAANLSLILSILFAAGAFALFMEKGERDIKVKLKNGSLTDLSFKYNIAGTIPAALASSIVMLPATILNFGVHNKFLEYFKYYSVPYFVLSVIVTFVLYFLITSLYYNPDKILSFLKRKNAEPVLPEGVSFEKLLDKNLTPLMISGAIYVSAFSVLLSQRIDGFIFISGLSFITGISIFLDIFNEVKARKRGKFVKLYEIQKPYEAKFIKNLLEQNNIFCFLEGYYHRCLLHFFGPYIGVSVYVPQDKEAEALSIIADS